MHCINTYYGHTIDYIKPDPNEIDIRDIAHNLSFENRFMGQTAEPYSVAQHCVLGSYAFDEMGLPDLAFRFLLHDAAEAYLKDIPTPLKHLLSEPYRNIEDRFNEAIHQRFGIEYRELPAIKSMDLAMFAAEKAQLLPPSTVPWPQLEGIRPANVPIVYWSPKGAEEAYLAQFKRLEEWLENENIYQAHEC
jgi:hypothetical protein